MQRRNLQPNLMTYSALMNACSQEDRSMDAIAALGQQHSFTNLVTYIALTCARQRGMGEEDVGYYYNGWEEEAGQDGSVYREVGDGDEDMEEAGQGEAHGAGDAGGDGDGKGEGEGEGEGE